MFRQSVAFFRPPKSRSWRDLYGSPASQWRTEPRLVRTARDRRTGRLIPHGTSPVDLTAGSGVEVQGGGSGGNGIPPRDSNFRQGGVRSAGPVSPPVRLLAVSGGINEKLSRVLRPDYQKNSQAPQINLKQQKEQDREAIGVRQIKTPFGAQISPNSRDILTASVRQPGLNVRNYGLTRGTASSVTPAGAWITRKDISYPGSSRGVDHTGFTKATMPTDVPNREAKLVNASRPKKATGGSSANLYNRTNSLSHPRQTPPLSYSSDSAFTESENSGSGGPDSARNSFNTNSIAQSSSVAGELWLDTLSLRHWLQEFLTGEIGRSFRATNRITS